MYEGGEPEVGAWDKRETPLELYGEDRKQARERAISKIVFYSFL